MAVRTAAVIGCGDVSVVHFEAIDVVDDAELVAVCDPDPGRRDAASRRYGVPGYATHTELLDAVRPDVVHVTTPHDQHVQASVDALAAGVHVLQEKPVAHTLAEGARLARRLADQIGDDFQLVGNPSGLTAFTPPPPAACR